MTECSVSVVLPAFNEAGSLEGVVRRVDRVLDAWPGRHEIVVVDDGSTDETPAIARRLAGELPRVRVVTHDRNKGYGAAQRSGIAAATGELVCGLPADGQIAPEELHHYLAAADRADVIVGAYRARPDSFARRLFSRAYLLVLWLLFRVRLRNINAPKLYRRAHLRDVRITSRGGFADAEVVLQLHARGKTFAEIEIDCLPRETGRSSVGPLAAFQAIHELWKFRRSGRYRSSASG